MKNKLKSPAEAPINPEADSADVEPGEPMLEGWILTDEQRKFIESLQDAPEKKPDVTQHRRHEKKDLQPADTRS